MLHPHTGRGEGTSARGGGSATDLPGERRDGPRRAPVLALAGARTETAPGETAEEVERDLTFFGLVE